MAGQLQSAIVEIRLMYDSFLSLRNLTPDLPPDCVVECLEKYFDNVNCNRSMFTRGNTTDQIKIMKNLETAYTAYKNLSKTSPKSAPTALIKALDAIMKSSNLVKVETETQPSISCAQGSSSFAQEDDARDDQLDSRIEIIHVESLQNSNNDNHDEEFEDSDPLSNSDGSAHVQNEEVVDNEAIPSTSFSFIYNPVQQRVVNWVQGQPIAMCGSDQDKNNSGDDVEDASRNTTDAENIEENAEEIASNGDSSSSSDFSAYSNQNDSGIQATPKNKKVYECSYGCGKTYRSKSWRRAHEKIHSGIGLFNCGYCDRQFTTGGSFAKHQIACRNPGAAKRRRRGKGVKKRLSKRIRCEFCYTKFTDLEGLERHRATYTQERLKRCRFPPCTRGFCYKHNRDSHEGKHARLQFVDCEQLQTN